jgi:hypothetical protein
MNKLEESNVGIEGFQLLQKTTVHHTFSLSGKFQLFSTSLLAQSQVFLTSHHGAVNRVLVPKNPNTAHLLCEFRKCCTQNVRFCKQSLKFSSLLPLSLST